MNVLYWNIRGIDNFATKIALRNLFLSHKPVIIFIVEPMILNMFPRGIGIILELFTTEFMGTLGKDISSTVLSVSDQCITLQISYHQSLVYEEKLHVVLQATEKSIYYWYCVQSFTWSIGFCCEEL
ncbi:hypothetical protein MTR_6g084460 [Medicago truncatula]|uniref:Uncharacterized protein n=1 Tax=Medicago truncatula TaxID=3880 RepID=G7KN43_MEDTR|nr:hypothetical protein MTR_6g084460 [Medicago truncatula]